MHIPSPHTITEEFKRWTKENELTVKVVELAGAFFVEALLSVALLSLGVGIAFDLLGQSPITAIAQFPGLWMYLLVFGAVFSLVRVIPAAVDEWPKPEIDGRDPLQIEPEIIRSMWHGSLIACCVLGDAGDKRSEMRRLALVYAFQRRHCWCTPAWVRVLPLPLVYWLYGC